MNYSFNKLSISELDEAAQFIANLNSKETHHIGYCGTEKDDILKTLKEDFIQNSETTVVACFLEHTLQAIIGLDIDEDCAEVWGPFSINEDLKRQHQLWGFLMEQFPEVTQFQFFINEHNILQQQFMNELQTQKTGEHLYLEIIRDTFEPVTTILSKSYEEQDFAEFTHIHTDAFPKTYYNAATILQKIKRSNTNKLKILKSSDGVTQGYVYYEIDLGEQTAHLEYIAIASEYRGLGLGTTLLREVLTDIFSYEEVKGITLTVNHTNDRANYVYLKAGFQKKAILWSFEWNKDHHTNRK